MSTSIQKLVLYFNGFQFFFSLLWWVPIFYEYQKRVGLNDVEIFKIQSWYYLIFCLLEIPTGFIADRLGYRFCLKSGALALVLANALIPFFGSYDGFFWHFTLIALSRSLISGASSAYLYDAFKKQGALDAYKDAEGRARAISLVGKVVCWGLVGPIMAYKLSLPYWLTAVNALVAVGFAWALPHVDHKSKDSPHVGLLEFFQVLYKSPYLILIMAQGVSIFVLTRIGQVNLFQPILESKGFQATTYGLVMAGMTIMEAIGSFRTQWLAKYLKDRNAISLLTLVLASTFVMLASRVPSEQLNQGFTLLAFGLFSYVIGISYPIQRKLMNDAIPDSRFRATLLSTESIIDRAMNSVVAFFLGAAITEGRLSSFLVNAAWVSFISTLAIAAGIFYYKKQGAAHVSFKS